MFLKGKIAILLKAKERILSVLSSTVELFQDVHEQLGSTNIEVVGFDPQDYILMLSDSDSENMSDSDDSCQLALNDWLYIRSCVAMQL